MKRHLSLAILTIVTLIQLNGQQVYPVNLTGIMIPPNSLDMSVYTQERTQDLIFNAILNDPVELYRDVKLRMTIRNNGQDLFVTDPNLAVPPIRLNQFQMETFDGFALQPYLSAYSFVGTSGGFGSLILPEGVNDICLEVIDIERNIPISRKACQLGGFFLNRPPQLLLPACGEEMPFPETQNLLFNWTPMHLGSGNPPGAIEYTFELVELLPGIVDPNDGFESALQIYQTTVMSPSLLYSQIEPTLEPNKTYGWRVQAKSITSSGMLFQNEGYSEVCTFSYISENGSGQGSAADDDEEDSRAIPSGCEVFSTDFGPVTGAGQNSIPIVEGDIVKLGYFELEISDATPSSDGFAGTGFVTIPMLASKMQVDFENLKVKSNMRAFAVESMTAQVAPEFYLDPSLMVPGNIQNEISLDYVENLQEYFTIGQGQNQLTSLFDPANPAVVSLPIGIDSEENGEAQPMVAITGIRFTERNAYMTCIAYMPVENSDLMRFAGVDIGITPLGVKSNSILSMLDDVESSLSDIFELHILSGNNGSGMGMDCQGFDNFKMKVEVQIKEEYLVQASNQQAIRFKLKDATDDPGQYLGDIENFGAFAIPTMPGFEFNMENGQLDLNEAQKLEFSDPSSFYAAANSEEWKGMHLEEVTVQLPPEYDFSGNNRSITLETGELFLSKEGAYGSFYTANLIDIENGRMMDWAYSVDTLELQIEEGRAGNSTMSGRIQVPILDEPFDYAAVLDINAGQTEIETSPEPGKVGMSLWSSSIAINDQTGVNAILMDLGDEGKQFVPNASLSGAFSLDLNQGKFTDLLEGDKDEKKLRIRRAFNLSGDLDFEIADLPVENFTIDPFAPATEKYNLIDFGTGADSISIAGKKLPMTGFKVIYQNESKEELGLQIEVTEILDKLTMTIWAVGNGQGGFDIDRIETDVKKIDCDCAAKEDILFDPGSLTRVLEKHYNKYYAPGQPKFDPNIGVGDAVIPAETLSFYEDLYKESVMAHLRDNHINGFVVDDLLNPTKVEIPFLEDAWIALGDDGQPVINQSLMDALTMQNIDSYSDNHTEGEPWQLPYDLTSQIDRIMTRNQTEFPITNARLLITDLVLPESYTGENVPTGTTIELTMLVRVQETNPNDVYLKFTKAGIAIGPTEVSMEGVKLFLTEDAQNSSDPGLVFTYLTKGENEDPSSGSYVELECEGFQGYNVQANLEFTNGHLVAKNMDEEGELPTNENGDKENFHSHALFPFTIKGTSLTSFVAPLKVLYEQDETIVAHDLGKTKTAYFWQGKPVSFVWPGLEGKNLTVVEGYFDYDSELKVEGFPASVTEADKGLFFNELDIHFEGMTTMKGGDTAPLELPGFNFYLTGGAMNGSLKLSDVVPKGKKALMGGWSYTLDKLKYGLFPDASGTDVATSSVEGTILLPIFDDNESNWIKYSGTLGFDATIDGQENCICSPTANFDIGSALTDKTYETAFFPGLMFRLQEGSAVTFGYTAAGEFMAGATLNGGAGLYIVEKDYDWAVFDFGYDLFSFAGLTINDPGRIGSSTCSEEDGVGGIIDIDFGSWACGDTAYNPPPEEEEEEESENENENQNENEGQNQQQEPTLGGASNQSAQQATTTSEWSTGFQGFPISLDELNVTCTAPGKWSMVLGVSVNLIPASEEEESSEDGGSGGAGGGGTNTETKTVAISASTDLTINLFKDDDGELGVEEVLLNALIVEGEIASVGMKGMALFLRDDPVWGDGVKAYVDITVPTLSLKAVVQFGNTKVDANYVGQSADDLPTYEITDTHDDDYRYFFADVEFVSEKGVTFTPTPITWHGISGGIFYNCQGISPATVPEDPFAGKTEGEENPMPIESSTNINIECPFGDICTPGVGLSMYNYVPKKGNYGGHLSGIFSLGHPTTVVADVGIGIQITTDPETNMLMPSVVTYSRSLYAAAETIRDREAAPITGSITLEADLINYRLSGAFNVNMTYEVEGALTLEADINGSMFIQLSGENAGKWYFKLGSPLEPSSVTASIDAFGGAKRKVEFYFQTGFELDDMPAIKDLVPNWPESGDADGRGSSYAFEQGDGIVLGYKDSFSGNPEFGPFYASFAATYGFDLSMMRYEDIASHCYNGDAFGLNNWYIQGQAYAYIEGEAGINYDLGFVSGSQEIFSGYAAVSLEMKFPNPTWAKAFIQAEYSVLDGLITGSMSFQWEVGDQIPADCLPETSVLDLLIPIVGSTYPDPNTTSVAPPPIYLSPELGFNVPVGEHWDFPIYSEPDEDDEEGAYEKICTRTFRSQLTEFYLEGPEGEIVEGTIDYPDAYQAIMKFDELLQAETLYKLHYRAVWQEFKDPGIGNTLYYGATNLHCSLSEAKGDEREWEDVLNEGEVMEEIGTIPFITDEFPDHLPPEAIEFSQPGVGQRYWTKNYAVPMIEIGQKGWEQLFPAKAKDPETQKTVVYEYKVQVTEYTKNEQQTAQYTLPLNEYPGLINYETEKIAYETVALNETQVQIPAVEIDVSNGTSVEFEGLNDLPLSGNHIYYLQILKIPVQQASTITREQESKTINGITFNRSKTVLANNQEAGGFQVLFELWFGMSEHETFAEKAYVTFKDLDEISGETTLNWYHPLTNHVSDGEFMEEDPFDLEEGQAYIRDVINTNVFAFMPENRFSLDHDFSDMSMTSDFYNYLEDNPQFDAGTLTDRLLIFDDSEEKHKEPFDEYDLIRLNANLSDFVFFSEKGLGDIEYLSYEFLVRLEDFYLDWERDWEDLKWEDKLDKVHSVFVSWSQDWWDDFEKYLIYLKNPKNVEGWEMVVAEGGIEPFNDSGSNFPDLSGSGELFRLRVIYPRIRKQQWLVFLNYLNSLFAVLKPIESSVDRDINVREVPDLVNSYRDIMNLIYESYMPFAFATSYVDGIFMEQRWPKPGQWQYIHESLTPGEHNEDVFKFENIDDGINFSSVGGNQYTHSNDNLSKLNPPNVLPTFGDIRTAERNKKKLEQEATRLRNKADRAQQEAIEAAAYAASYPTAVHYSWAESAAEDAEKAEQAALDAEEIAAMEQPELDPEAYYSRFKINWNVHREDEYKIKNIWVENIETNQLLCYVDYVNKEEDIYDPITGKREKVFYEADIDEGFCVTNYGPVENNYGVFVQMARFDETEDEIVFSPNGEFDHFKIGNFTPFDGNSSTINRENLDHIPTPRREREHLIRFQRDLSGNPLNLKMFFRGTENLFEISALSVYEWKNHKRHLFLGNKEYQAGTSSESDLFLKTQYTYQEDGSYTTSTSEFTDNTLMTFDPELRYLIYIESSHGKEIITIDEDFWVNQGGAVAYKFDDDFADALVNPEGANHALDLYKYRPEQFPSNHPEYVEENSKVFLGNVEKGNGAIQGLPLQDITIEAWIKPDEMYDQFNNILGFYNNEGELTYSWLIEFHGETTELKAHFSLDNVPMNLRLSGVIPNAWNHIACTYDGSYVRWFLNGNFKAEAPASGLIDYSHEGRLILGEKESDQILINMLIDEVMIWSKARTLEEIRDDMTNGRPGGEEGLIAYYKFNELPYSRTFPDLSGSGRDGIVDMQIMEDSYQPSPVPKSGEPYEDIPAHLLNNPNGFGTYKLSAEETGSITVWKDDTQLAATEDLTNIRLYDPQGQLHFEYYNANSDYTVHLHPTHGSVETEQRDLDEHYVFKTLDSLDIDDYFFLEREPTEHHLLLGNETQGYQYFNVDSKFWENEGGTEFYFEPSDFKTGDFLLVGNPVGDLYLLHPDMQPVTGMEIVIFDMDNNPRLIYKNGWSEYKVFSFSNTGVQTTSFGKFDGSYKFALDANKSYYCLLHNGNNEYRYLSLDNNFWHNGKKYWFNADDFKAGDYDQYFTSGDYALELDGNDDRIESPDNLPIEGDDERTVAAWVKFDQEAIGNLKFTPITVWGENANSKWFIFAKDEYDILKLMIDEETLYSGNTTLTADTWYYLAVTYGNEEIKLYINGVLDAAYSLNNPLQTTANSLRLGYFLKGQDSFYAYMTIDELNIWSRSRSEDEILEDYIYGVDPTEHKLELYYNFNSGPGNATVSDRSGRDFNSELVAMDITSSWVIADKLPGDYNPGPYTVKQTSSGSASLSPRTSLDWENVSWLFLEENDGSLVKYWYDGYLYQKEDGEVSIQCLGLPKDATMVDDAGAYSYYLGTRDSLYYGRQDAPESGAFLLDELQSEDLPTSLENILTANSILVKGDGGSGKIDMEWKTEEMYNSGTLCIYDDENRRVYYRNSESATFFEFVPKPDDTPTFYNTSSFTLSPENINLTLNPSRSYQVYYKDEDGRINFELNSSFLEQEDCALLLLEAFNGTFSDDYFALDADYQVYLDAEGQLSFKNKNSSAFSLIAEIYLENDARTRHWTSDGHLHEKDGSTESITCAELPRSGEHLWGDSPEQNWTIYVKTKDGTCYKGQSMELNAHFLNLVETTDLPAIWSSPSPSILVSADDDGIVRLDFNDWQVSKNMLVTVHDSQNGMIVYRYPGNGIQGDSDYSPPKFIRIQYSESGVYTETEESLVDFFVLDLGSSYTVYFKDLENGGTASLHLDPDFMTDDCELKLIREFNESISEEYFEDPFATPTSSAGDFALDFDGINDHLSFGEEDLDGFRLSMGLWLNAENLNGVQPLVGYSGNTRLELVDGHPKMVLQVDGQAVEITTEWELNTNTWYYLAGAYNGQEMRLYLNGELIKSQPQSGGVQTSGELFVGRGEDANGETYFSGQLDQISLWSKGLSEQETRNIVYEGLEGNEDGLFALLDLDQGTGQLQAKDVSNRGMDALLRGMDPATDWISGTAPNWNMPTGTTDYGVDLASDNNQIVIREAAGLNMDETFSIQFWAKSSYQGTDTRHILRKTNGWGVDVVDGNKLRLVTWGADDVTFGNFFYNNDTWHQYTFVADGNNRYLYVDGALVAENADSYTVESSEDPLYIGYTSSSARSAVDELGIFDRALTEEEVVNSYLEGINSDANGLVAYYNFDALPENQMVVDQSGNGHVGMIQNLSTSNWVVATKSVVQARFDLDVSNNIVSIDFSDWYQNANCLLTIFDTQERMLVFRHPGDDTNEAIFYSFDYDGEKVFSEKQAGQINQFELDANEEYTIYAKNLDDESWASFSVSNTIINAVQDPIWIPDFSEEVADSYFENPETEATQSVSDNAIQLNNDNDDARIYIEDSDELDLDETFTISFWAKKISSRLDYRQIIRKGGTWGVELGYSSTLRLISDNDDARFDGSFNNDGEWHHYTFLSQNNAQELFVDGISFGTLNEPLSFPITDQALHIGNSTNSPIIAIDELGIFDRTLSEDEVIDVYLNGIDPNNAVDLVAYYDFNQETESTILFDRSGNGHHGFLQNIDVTADWVTGDGKNPVPPLQSAPYNANLSLLDGDKCINTGFVGITGGSARTFEAWVKPSVIDGTTMTFVSWGDSDASGNLFNLKINSSGKLKLEVKDENQKGETSLIAGEWIHIAVVVDGNSPKLEDVKMYINGELESTTISNGDIDLTTSPDGKILIGSNVDGTEAFNGEMDEVRIWNTARSQQEIKDHLYGELSGDLLTSSDLELYYNFNETSAPYVDHSNNDYEGVLIDISSVEPPNDVNYALDIAQSGFISTTYKGITGKADRTFEAWIKTTSAGGAIASWGYNDTDGEAMKIHLDEQGRVRVSLTNGYRYGSTSVNDGEWHHIAVVVEDVNNNGNPRSGELKFFIDGVEETDYTTKGVTINTASKWNLVIGAYNDEDIFNGLIDEVRLWSIAKDQSAIQATINTKIADPELENDLQLYFPMQDGPFNDNISDHSSAGRDGTISEVTEAWVEATLPLIEISQPPPPAPYNANLSLFNIDECIRTDNSYAGITGSTARTFEAWIKTTTLNKTIVSWGDDVVKGNRFNIKLNDQGYLRVDISGGNIIGTQTVLSTDEWFHIAVVVPDQNPTIADLTFYINGEVEPAVAAGGSQVLNTSADGEVFIGCYFTGANVFQGEMDELRIWNAARSQQEIKDHLYGALTGEALNSPDLALYYSFDETGSSYTDQSVNGHNGTVVNISTIGTPPPPPAPLNYALDLGDASTHVASNWNGILGKGRRTVEAWIKTTASNEDIITWGKTVNLNDFRVRVDNNGSLAFVCGSGNHKKVGTTIINDGNWHHIALVAPNNETKVKQVHLYVDGELETYSSTGSNSKINTKADHKVAIGAYKGNLSYSGEIDEVRIWNIKRTPDQIKNNKDVELTGNESGLQLYYQISAGTGTTITDQSGKGRDGTMSTATNAWTERE